MRVLANRKIRFLFSSILGMQFITMFIIECYVFRLRGRMSIGFFLFFLLMMGLSFASLYVYFIQQDKMLSDAADAVQQFLDGDSKSRISCDEEGEIYRLFHQINMLASSLNSKVNKEGEEKQFLKDTISDISHQLKTPLAALSIYNGLLQGAENEEEIQEFVKLSENELDRINTLVQSLLKITRLDAGTIVIERKTESVADMMADIELHFSYQAKQENKIFSMEGSEDVRLCCDRSWTMEAIDNLVKNAFDHTKSGDEIHVCWQSIGNSIVQIEVRDTGSGIHPEDIHHVFKRFYRSRFSQDKTGLGLGLALTKAIIEAQDGSIEVESDLGRGTKFVINFWTTNL